MGKFKKRLKSVLTAGVAFLASAAIGVSLWKQPQAKGSTEQIHNGRILTRKSTRSAMNTNMG